jgi:hypothetical protein
MTFAAKRAASAKTAFVLALLPHLACSPARPAQPPATGVAPSAATNAAPSPNAPADRLTPDQIAAAVMARYGVIRACYEWLVPRGTSGYVSIEWDVQPEGVVRNARAVAADDSPRELDKEPVERLSDTRVENCIIGHMTRIRFPVARQSTHARWTFSFRPSRGGGPAAPAGEAESR